MENDYLGKVGPNSTPNRIKLIAYQKVVPSVGDYVIIEGDNEQLLGMVSDVTRGAIEFSRADLVQADYYDRILEVVEEPSEWAVAEVRIVGRLERGELVGLSRRPPPSGASVRRAPKEILQRIFSPPKGREGIRIGRLMSREDVEVFLDPDNLIARHLAVIAVTGGGKSNTVAVILEEILKMGGVAILFDVHSEYVGMEVECEGCHVEVVDPVLDPNKLSKDELASLLGISFRSAAKMYIYLSRAYNKAKSLLMKDSLAEVLKNADMGDYNSKDLLAGVMALLKLTVKDEEGQGIPLDNKKDRDSIYSLISRIDHLISVYGKILKPGVGDLTDHLDYGKLVIVNLGQLDLELTDVVVGKNLITLLTKSKVMKVTGERLIPNPVLAVIEEAHILLPPGGDTYTLRAASAIAKEGRKFGVGLCLVSQRPKKLDSDVLSQMVNKIILRIVEPDDQLYVRRATEFLSEELTSYLPSLNVGEAIIVGPMIRTPALVKVRLFQGKAGGETPSAYEAWQRGKREKELAKADEDYYDSIGD